MMKGIHKSTATLELANGRMLEMSYFWMIVNDGGDLQLLVWETDPDADDDCVSDLVMQKSIESPRFADLYVRQELKRAIGELVSGYIQNTCI